MFPGGIPCLEGRNPKGIKKFLGMDKIKGCEIEVKEVLREKVDGFYRDKLILKTEEDVWMPF